jgi:MFS family permease
VPSYLAVIRAALRAPQLRRMVGAFLLFSVGEWATWIGIIVYAYGRGGAGEAGVVACVIYVPSILVAPAASLFGDRFPRARVLVASYALQALSMGGTAIALAAGPPLLAYALATLSATSITLTRPAHGALLPEVVSSPDELAAANMASGTVEGLGALIGPLLAGILVGLGGPGGPAEVYAATATGAAVAALAVFPLAINAPRHPGGPSTRGLAALIRDLGGGVRTVLGDRRLVALLAVLSGSIALLGALNVFYAVVAVELLGLDESAIGYLAAAAGVGSVFGAAASGAMVGRERLAAALLGAAILFGAAVALVGLVPSSAGVALCLVAAGAGWAFVYVEALTLAQRLAGDNVMSRVFGVMEALMMASQSLGALAVPLLVVALGPSLAIVACGGALAAVALLAGPTLLRADRIEPGRIRVLRALRAVPMFSPLSAPVLEQLASGSEHVSAAADETIVSEGEVGQRFFVILSGTVRVSVGGQPVRTEGPGEWFGEIALLRDTPRTATVRAADPVELLAIDRLPFIEALTGQPRSHALARAVAEHRLADGTIEPLGVQDRR